MPIHTSKFNTQVFMLVFDILSESQNDIIMFILFNQLLTKIEIIQQSNSIKLKFSNELLMNVVLQTIEIFASFNIFRIIFEEMKCNKK